MLAKTTLTNPMIPQVTSMLHNLFSKFDALADANSAMLIETIGDGAALKGGDRKSVV